jgi:hypothetical protein
VTQIREIVNYCTALIWISSALICQKISSALIQHGYRLQLDMLDDLS